MTFPQLTSGALAQYPLKRRSVKRTVMTTAGDGSTVKLADEPAAAIEWTLQFDGLSSAEWASLEAFFENAGGQLNTFTFVDPLGNLLAWSSDLTQSEWQKGPGLSVSGGLADPFGGSQACRVVNGAQAVQAVTQSAGVPGGYQYTLSVYASAPSAETITLVQQSGGEVSRTRFPIAAGWTRCTASAKLNSPDELVTFGLQLEPGATVLLAGFQAEAQPRAGAYIQSFHKPSVYSCTRFMDDGLETTSSAPDQYSCVVRLRSTGA